MWSPALQNARDTILFWTLVLKRLKRHHIGARRILRLKRKLKIEGNTNLPQETVQKKLDEAYKQYKVCRKNDAALRRNYLEDLAHVKAQAGNTKAYKMLREMQLRENTRRVFRRIRYTILNHNRSALQRFMSKSEEERWKSLKRRIWRDI